MRRAGCLLVALVMAILPWSAVQAVVIDFERFPDQTILTDQIPGITFETGALVLSARKDGSLDTSNFPPKSGKNVIFDAYGPDASGPILIRFAELQPSVGAYFTYLTFPSDPGSPDYEEAAVPLTITAFDLLGNPVATATSAFLDNTLGSGAPGSSPNEFLSVGYALGISRVRIQKNPLGTSFTLDDLTFPVPAAPVPEPGTLLLLGSGLVGAAGLARWRWRAR